MPLDFSLRFFIVLGSIWVPFLAPKWLPGGAAGLVVIGPGAVQDGLGIVLVRSFFRLAVRVRLFDPLGLLLGSSGGALGPVLGCLGLSWARFGHSGGHFGAFNYSLISYVFFLLSAFFSLPMALGTVTLLNPGPAGCALHD